MVCTSQSIAHTEVCIRRLLFICISAILFLQANGKQAHATAEPNVRVHASNYKGIKQIIEDHRREQQQTQPQQTRQSYQLKSHQPRHQNRLPQPIHKSILARRKSTVLRVGDIDDTASVHGDLQTTDTSLRQPGRKAAVVETSETNQSTSAESNGTELEATEDASFTTVDVESQHNDSSIESSANTSEEGQQQSTQKEHHKWTPPEPPSPLLVSPWWVRITEEPGNDSFNFPPASRRATSSVVFTYKPDEDGVVRDLVGRDESIAKNSTNMSQPNEQHSPQSQADTAGEEYMIISGGYTDHDWRTFPVYAFPITSSIRTESGEWIELSPTSSELSNNHSDSFCMSQDGAVSRDRLYQQATYLKADDVDSSDYEDPWEHASPCPPTGRMGHSSVIHNDNLYVFGGLIYDEEQAPAGSSKESFRLEDVPYVYRLDLQEMFEARKVTNKRRRAEDYNLVEDATTIMGSIDSMTEERLSSEAEAAPSSRKVKGWQRIIPRVKPFPTSNGMPPSAASEVLLKSVNRGEMQGGLWKSKGETDKFVMYGGLRIAQVDYDAHGPHCAPSKVVKGSSHTVGIGESSQVRSHKIVELPLGDVWAYDLELDAWEKITNDYGRAISDVDAVDNAETSTAEGKEASNDDDSSWWADLDASLFPRPRTAHAATVVGDELIIHGGMGWNERTNDWDGGTDWKTLEDMWIFNLSTRTWKRRWLIPLLLRSYHSLVGWNVEDSLLGADKGIQNLTSWTGPVVAAFGGYTTGIDVFSGEEVAYVFDDVLVSYPPPLIDEDDLGFLVGSPWLKASMPEYRDGDVMISNRFEHAAVVSKEGVMVVWGGQFQDTSNLKGVWAINLGGRDSQVSLVMAGSDGIYDEYDATITALHTFVIMMMFMSMSLTLILGMTQRYNELLQQANADAEIAGMAFAAQDVGGDAPSAHRARGRGLHPEIIATLPEKIYSSSESDRGEDGTVDDEDKDDCCPICLGKANGTFWNA